VKIGVLALQGDVREHLRALDSAGATPIPVKHPEDIAAVDALVVPGGESTTIGKLVDRFGLLDPIATRARAGMPMYGTCAGMILMAREIVGEQAAPYRFDLLDISVRRNAYGRQVDSFEADLDVTGLEEPFRAVFIRAPSVEAAGDDVQVLATFEGLPVVVAQGPHLASSFHPEMTEDHRIHELFVKKVEEL
jgi:5'-phosphate synthase pdxT subunit